MLAVAAMPMTIPTRSDTHPAAYSFRFQRNASLILISIQSPIGDLTNYTLPSRLKQETMIKILFFYFLYKFLKTQNKLKTI